MNSMVSPLKSLRALTLSLAVCAVSMPAFAGGFVVDEANSNVNFSVTKVQYVIEPAEFKKVTGQVSKDGEAEFVIDISSVFSDNDVRDKRLIEMFFQTEFFATAVISADIEAELMSAKKPTRASIPATIEWFDHTAEIELDVMVAPTSNGGLLVTSMAPTIIDAKKFGVPTDHLEALRKVCNNISIADKAAVNFVLTLKKS